MLPFSLRRGLPLLGAALLLIAAVNGQESRGRKYKPPPPTCKISVTVVRADNGKPIEDAAVVFHPIEHGKDKGNMELKTNEDGKAILNMIPIGDTLRLQVIADGFQTFGNDYELPTDSKDIDIKMNKPQRQYSIYEKHPDQGGQSGSGQNGSGQGGNPPQGGQTPQNPPH
ncbi:MAG: carboxypeptidase-like regulatory domain-containing protein [Acidobacteriaceae bacterium]